MCEYACQLGWEGRGKREMNQPPKSFQVSARAYNVARTPILIFKTYDVAMISARLNIYHILEESKGKILRGGIFNERYHSNIPCEIFFSQLLYIESHLY